MKKWIWTGLCICLLTLGCCFTAAAAEYPAVDISARVNECRLTQRERTDCAITSIATIEAYMNYKTGNSQAVYRAVKRANGGSNECSWTSMGYKAYKTGRNFGGDEQAMLQTIYARLSRGEPVIVKRNSSPEHYSVVVGYSGSTDTLEIKNFKVIDVLRSSGTISMDQWIRQGRLRRGNKIVQLVVRQRGVLRNEVPVQMQSTDSAVHQHFFEGVEYETAHPHRAFQSCQCGQIRYTGTFATAADCVSCILSQDDAQCILMMPAVVARQASGMPVATETQSVNLLYVQEYHKGEDKLRVVETKE